MSLLESLSEVGAHLSPTELPDSRELQQTVGALVKVVEAAGITVTEDLLPKPVADVAVPVEQAAASAVTPELGRLLQGLVDRVEEIAEKVEGKPVSEVEPVEVEQHSQGITEPAAPAPTEPAGPSLPPLEGAM